GIMNLHATNGSVDSNLKFEFDNTDARTANISKIGTGDNQLLNDDFVATIMYHDGSGNLDVSDAGLGSIIVSGFDGSGEVDGANNANVFTIHAAAGNTADDAFTFSGNIFQDGTTSSDLTIVKEGGGEQILTGNVNVADSTNTNTSGGLNIQEGTLKLAPAASKTHKFEYLHGEAGTTLVLDNSNQETVELGFANTTYASYGNANPTHSGAVTLEGSNGNVTIKVVSDTAKTDANYGKEQVISGVVSGTESLTKSGLGRLMLSGTNTFDGGATDVVISDGTLVAAHADALGGANTKVVINKGKLEIGNGNNGAVTLHTGTTIEGSASGKSMVGGDGTINALTVGSATAEVDVISPGRGISSSLTSNTSQQQVTFGTGDAPKATGDLTVTTLAFNNGGVYDWEISDFSGSAGDG
ncbi:MAG: autotransporter-associated beta strand repeat-containing protein, partial [Verrucomicrobiota bacterium]|nr:autotransporter-associated beta strand repeat-containing protein [Verrucomicrobiota bacterium]